MHLQTQTVLALSLTAALLASAGNATAADQQELLDKIQKLEQRVAELEGRVPQAEPKDATKPVEAWLGATKFSGFASVSYWYNFNRVDPITGRFFDLHHNQFELNKLKLTLEKPVDFNPDKWNVGYRADLIFGQDAEKIQSAGLNLGNAGDLEQMYVTANVPVGRGLQVAFGKMVTLMGVEVIEEVVNPNWSEGNQFIFVENATSTGLQLSYKWTDKIDTQVRVINGWDVVTDNNNALSYMGRVGFAPTDKTSISLIGYGGPEQPDNSRSWRMGGDLVFSQKITPKLTLWAQGDYGREDASTQMATATGNPSLATDDAEWWAVGGWLTYDFTDKIGVALRGDFLKDEDGARTSKAPTFAPFPSNTGQDLTSVTLTLNLKPYTNFQVRPEVRWDHSNKDLFPHQGSSPRKDQYTAGLGVAYLF